MVNVASAVDQRVLVVCVGDGGKTIDIDEWSVRCVSTARYPDNPPGAEV